VKKAEVAAPQPAIAPQPPQSAPAPPVQAADLSPASAPGRVGQNVEEKTWISVSSDGKNVFANLLQPHDTKVVEASEKVRILIGNAGGVEISLNGKSIGPIGPRGQIRVVELTPAGFQIVPRKSTLEPL
jgi:cytoskeleton protein RodZ